jgi:hypothetical protein
METNMKSRSTVSTWVRSAVVAPLGILIAFVLSAGCSQDEGSACNPALSHDECDNAPNVQCVQPSLTMYPLCYGNAYCCTTDMNGNITDTSQPNCLWLSQCMAASVAGDGGMEAAAPDAGTPDTSTSPDTGTGMETGTGADTSTEAAPEAGGDSTVPTDAPVSDATGSEGG